MRYILAVAILAGTLLSSCSSHPSVGETSSELADRPQGDLGPEEEVIEAVFRYQIENYPLSIFPSARVHCVSMPGATNPTPALLARLDVSGEVRTISDCKVNSEVTDSRTGQRGIVFKVDSILELNESEALVEGGYYYDPFMGRIL
jgi:hypothetical protein